jgi:hypothetical protein
MTATAERSPLPSATVAEPGAPDAALGEPPAIHSQASASRRDERRGPSDVDSAPPAPADLESERAVPPLEEVVSVRADRLDARRSSALDVAETPPAGERSHQGRVRETFTVRAATAVRTASTSTASPDVTVLAPATAPRIVQQAPEPTAITMAPTIRITIGRVDVRAVTPPATAPRPAPTPPQPLSLEDYAKQREGRRR